MSGNETPNLWDDLVMQPVLSPREKALRDAFVTEYLTDYDAWGAAIRIGFLKSVAGHYAQEMMEDPYVRQQITARQQVMAADPESERKVKQRQIEAWVTQQAHYRGPGASHGGRVQALGLLMKMYKMIDNDDDASNVQSKEEALIKAFREFAQKVPV